MSIRELRLSLWSIFDSYNVNHARFDGTNEWMGRRDALINTVKTNPLAPYVIRSIDVGSEPLYDCELYNTALVDKYCTELSSIVRGTRRIL